jgi:hypothetical protein
MVFDEKSRRQFLAGAGKLGLLLPLPTLPSLMPRSAWGAIPKPPIRFVQSLHTWGQFEAAWLPKIPATQVLYDTWTKTPNAHLQLPALPTLDAANKIKGVMLTDPSIPGPISKVLGPAFTGLKSKMNVMRGLDVSASDYVHNLSLGNCAAMASGGSYPGPGHYSVEYVLSSSRKVYPNGTAGIVPYLNVSLMPAQYAGYAENYSWTPKGKLSMLTNVKAVYAKFAGAFNPTIVDPKSDPAQVARIKLVQEVYQDYKAVVDRGKLSATDRPRFEAYMTTLAEVEKDLSAPKKVCQDPKPAFTGGETDDQAHADLAKIMGAALACQLTNVVNYIHTTNYNVLHPLQHQGKVVEHSDITAAIGDKIGRFWTLLDNLREADGTSVLDNSIAHWSGNNGLNLCCGFSHTTSNLCLATAGSGGGRLRTGYFLEFGNQPGFNGRPYNNWLVTILTGMGLTYEDYETPGLTGFGEYVNTPADLKTDSARRTPLPFVWRG